MILNFIPSTFRKHISKLSLKSFPDKIRMKLLSAFLLGVAFAFGQNQVFDNFEGIKYLHYAEKTGALDTAFVNPSPNEVNKSLKCGKYVRNAKHKYDFIKLRANGKFSDVTLYASHLGNAPVLKMKIYSTAPVGTLVEIQLGKASDSPYPKAIHSQYQAYTSVVNEWEELEFRFAQVPPGSETSPNEITQITIMFDPNSSSRYTFYFDELSGPMVLADMANENKKK